MTVKVASEWLNSCSGCEISILDMGERLLDVLNLVEFVHLPALSNAQVLERYYGTETTDPPEAFPEQDLPSLLERCMALDEKITVDIYMPGCPPHPDHIFNALAALVEGRTPGLPDKSVCDTCPTRREGKGAVNQIRRNLEPPTYGGGREPLDQMRYMSLRGFEKFVEGKPAEEVPRLVSRICGICP